LIRGHPAGLCIPHSGIYVAFKLFPSGARQIIRPGTTLTNRTGRAAAIQNGGDTCLPEDLS